MGFYEQILFNHISRAVVFVPNSVINDLLASLANKEALDLEPIDKSYHLLSLQTQNENLLNTFCPLLVNSHLPIAVTSHQILLKWALLKLTINFQWLSSFYRFIPFLMKDSNVFSRTQCRRGRDSSVSIVKDFCCRIIDILRNGQWKKFQGRGRGF